MPAKIKLLDATELAKLDTLSESQFNKNKKQIFDSTKERNVNFDEITEQLIAYGQYDKSVLINPGLNQKRFIEIIISISRNFPDVLTQNLLKALGVQATNQLVEGVYAKIWVENKKESVKKIALNKAKIALPILNQLELVLAKLTTPIDQTAPTPIKSAKKLRFAHIFNPGESNIDRKKTRSNPAIAVAKKEKNSKKTRSSPTFIPRQLRSNENKNTSNSDYNIRDNDEQFKSNNALESLSRDIDFNDFNYSDSKNSPLDFADTASWSLIADHTKKAINSIKHAFPQKIAIASPAPTPSLVLFTSETLNLGTILPLEENQLFPYQNEIADFSQAEQELKAAMLKDLNLSSLKEAEEEPLIQQKCKEKIDLLENKWNYLTNELKNKNVKLDGFSDATLAVQEQIKEKLQQIVALKAEAKNKLDSLQNEWSLYLAEHFIDVPDTYLHEHTSVYNKSEKNYAHFMKEAEQCELALRIQLKKVEIYLQSFTQQEYLAHSTYTKLKAIYQQKINSFESTITFIEDAQRELEIIHKTIANLPDNLAEQLEEQQKKTNETLTIVLTSINAAKHVFADLERNKYLAEEEQQNYVINFEKLQQINLNLTQSGNNLLVLIKSLQNTAPQYNNGRTEALDPNNNSSMPHAIQSLAQAIENASLRYGDAEKKTLQGATSSGLENLRKNAEYILSNAQTCLKSLQFLRASLSEDGNPAFKNALTGYNDLVNDFNNQNEMVRSYLDLVAEREQNERDRIANEKQTREAREREMKQLEIERQKREAKQSKLNEIAALQRDLLDKITPAGKQEISEDEQLLQALPTLSENLTENIAKLQEVSKSVDLEKGRTNKEIAEIKLYARPAAEAYANPQLSSVLAEEHLAQLKKIQNIAVGHTATIENAKKAKSLLLEKSLAIHKEIKNLPVLDIKADESALEQRLNLLSEKTSEIDELLEQNEQQLTIVKDDINTFLGHIEAYINNTNNIEESDCIQTINEVCADINNKVKELVENADNEIARNKVIITRIKTRNLKTRIFHLTNQITDLQLERLEDLAQIDKTHHLERSKRYNINRSANEFKEYLKRLLETVRQTEYLSNDEKAKFFKELKKCEKNLSNYAAANKPKTKLLQNEENSKNRCATLDDELTDLFSELNTNITLERADAIDLAIHANRVTYNREKLEFKKVNDNILKETTSKLTFAQNTLKLLDDSEGAKQGINVVIKKKTTVIARTSKFIQKSFWGLFQLSPIAAGAIAGAVIGFHVGFIPGAVVGGILGAGAALIGEKGLSVIANKLAGTKTKQTPKTKYETKLDEDLAEFMLVDEPAPQANKISTIKSASKPQPEQKINCSPLYFQSAAHEPSPISICRPPPHNSVRIMQDKTKNAKAPAVHKNNCRLLPSWLSYFSTKEPADLQKMEPLGPGIDLDDDLVEKKETGYTT